MSTYRLERCLDRLSGIEVYSGQMTRDSGSGHRVTILVATSPGADEAALRASGERLARVTHPAVPRLRDVFALDGHAAWVVDEVHGRSLAALLAERPVPPRAAFEIGAQLAGALQAAHAGVDRVTGTPRRIRHESLEARSVIVDRHGEVRLIGIGTGRPAGLGGAPSPERVLAQEEGLESDVFTLGSLIVEATGQVPLLAGLDDDELHRLVVDPVALREVCDERIDGLRARLGTDRGVALLRAMTAVRKTDRPSMAQVAARCDLISDNVDSPGLVEFARARVPAADREEVDGRYVGREVTTQHRSLWTTTETPPPPVVRSATPRPATPRPAPLPAQSSGAPVLGERPLAAEEGDTIAMATAQGPMPWSPAETLALFERTPSLAPPRELQPVVVDPHRIPQLVRQQWDDGVARRYRLAQMRDQLVEEMVDEEEAPTLVVREAKEPAPPAAAPEPDADLVEPPPVIEPAPAPAAPEPWSVMDAPDVVEAGAGEPRRPVSVPLPVPGSIREQAQRQVAAEDDADEELRQTLTPPAFPVSTGMEGRERPPESIPSTYGTPVAPAPRFEDAARGGSPTVVPLTDAGDDSVLATDPGDVPHRTPAASGGLGPATLFGMLIGGVIGIVAGVAALYLLYLSGPK